MIVHCAACNAELPPGADRCIRCGSTDIMIGIYTPSGMRVSMAKGPGNGPLRINGTKHETVKGTFLRQHLKQEWSSDRQQMEYVERVFDRAQGVYRETYYDMITGQITFRKEGDIRDQTLHGKRAQ